MDLNGMFAFVQKPLSLRAATNIVLAAILAFAGLAFVWGYVHPLLIEPGWPAWTVPGFVLGVCVVAFAVATILTHAVMAAGAARRGMMARRAASREAASQAVALGETRVREEERLAALLPSFPDGHRALLSKFAEGSAPHALLNRADGYHGDAITHALVTAGFLVYSAPVNPTQSLYALHPDAARPIRTYFEGVRQAEAAKRRERAETAVRDADASARQLLSLFGEPNPESATSAPHPWLTNDVYGSIRGLVREGVLTQVADGHQLPRRNASVPGAEPLTEPIVLTDGGKDAVERHVLHRPVARIRIDLRLDHIASAVARGSGLTGSY